ncbi:hypothetical protein IB237_24745 [Agrobacterium sp. AGB01]|jgi:predicted Zn-dependent peptidase|uniref:hypothetical protein n=1 Tax=Agrobacterium sp. AGB01 TaxID=2769302 RepID=UPI001787357E|nr:hypothetical protein [Agrobacterium sp. AGB01]MBD9390416.1 hypothetical protein [Agrobacterium sp. AGB01]
MMTDLRTMSAPVDFDDMDKLTDQMFEWSRQHKLPVEDLLSKRHAILSRFRAGERQPERLFQGL